MMEEDIVVPEKKKRNPVVAIIIVLFLLLLAVIGGGVYLIYKNTTAENVLKKNLTFANIGTKAFLSGKENYSFDIEKDHIIQKVVMTVKGEGETLKAIDGLGIDVRNSFSLKEEYLDINAYLKQNNASLGVNAYVSGQNVYLEAKDIGLPLIKQDLGENLFTTLKEELADDTKLETKDLEYAVEKITKYISESLTESNTSTSNSGTIFTFKYMINNKNNDDPFVKNFIESVLADKELLRILEITEEDLKNTFNLLDSVDITVTYDILKREYTGIDGVLVVENHLNDTQTKEIKFTYEKLPDGNYKFTSGDLGILIKEVSEGTSFVISNKGEDKITVTLYDTSDDVIKLAASIAAEYDINGVKSKSTIDYLMNVHFEDNNKISSKVTVNGKIDKDSFELKIDASWEIRNDSIIKGDFKDAKGLEQLTAEEAANIEKKIDEKTKEFDFYKYIEEISKQLVTNEAQSTTM